MGYNIQNFIENLREKGLACALKEDAKETLRRTSLVGGYLTGSPLTKSDKYILAGSALAGLSALVLGVSTSAYEGNKKIQLPCKADLSCYRIEEFKIDADKDGKLDSAYTHIYDSKGKEITIYLDQNGDGKIDVAFTPWGTFYSEDKKRSRQYADVRDENPLRAIVEKPKQPLNWCDKYPDSPSCP